MSTLPEGRGDGPLPNDLDEDEPESEEAQLESRPSFMRTPEDREEGGALDDSSPVQPHQTGIRIQKAMARAGIASRREAERIVAAGEVRVNDKDVRQPGYLLAPGDKLEVQGRNIDWERSGAHELWVLYKPKRCVCTLTDPEGRRTVKDFFPQSEQRLFPIGRLDYDAEGLLLLTNDGALAHRVTHPSYGVPRAYLVKVRGTIETGTIKKLARGITLDGVPRRPVRVRVIHTVNDKTWVEVILREGIHHHLKKMFSAVGHPVLKIKRYRIGPIELGDLQPGRVRKLGRADIERLMHWWEPRRGRAQQARADR